MNGKYSHLLSPLKIGNVVLKNRMLSSNATPHFFQGPESFPSDALISYLSGLARNGAAVVTFGDWSNKDQRKGRGDSARMPMFTLEDPSVETYFCQLTDAIHFYNSKACIGVRSDAPGYDASPAPMRRMPPEMGGPGGPPAMSKEIPEERIQEMIAETVRLVKYYQSVGFDMTSFHLAYRNTILAHFLSPLHNKRTDKYGGSMENRARVTLDMCDAVKKACGKDFLIEIVISGEDDEPGGNTVDDIVAFAKLCEGHADIFQLRGKDGDLAHPTGFNSIAAEPITLKYAEALKKSGTGIVIEPIGGYQDPDQCEEIIALGKADMIGMGRALFVDPEYGIKLAEGRGDDVVPCIRCNRCHGIHFEGPWLNVCSVNPTMGIAHKVNRMISVPGASKKVAVIGSGPAGMKAAIVCAERGHHVTLYEKADSLGGQMIHANYHGYKWPIKQFKDYLISQMNKLGVRVLVNTEATPELIKAGGFDEVIAATGSQAIFSDIPGANGPNIWLPTDVYGCESKLGKNVVVVGGSEIGTETGMYLAENGHTVTVLTRQKQLASSANRPHYYGSLETAFKSLKTFSYLTEVTTTKIMADKVTYVDAKGEEHTLSADNVVVAGGMNSRQDEALKFSDAGKNFHMIGDCWQVGDIRTSIRSAFATASLI